MGVWESNEEKRGGREEGGGTFLQEVPGVQPHVDTWLPLYTTQA